MSKEKLFIKDLANLGEIESFLDWHMQTELTAMYECYPNFEKGFNFTSAFIYLMCVYLIKCSEQQWVYSRTCSWKVLSD